MTNCTDQIRAAAAGGAESVSRTAVGEVLALMAGHLTRVRPAALLTPVALGACVAGEVYNARGRTSLGSGAALSEAVTAALPLADFTATRRAYAVLLREAAVEHGWTEDDNRRAIPTVPGQRPAPVRRPAAPVPAPRPSTGRAGR